VVNFTGTSGDRSHCFRKRVWIAYGPHDKAQSRSVERVLAVRYVALRHRFAGGATLPHVTDNTNDRHAL
jgi:hypothetical protein